MSALILIDRSFGRQLPSLDLDLLESRLTTAGSLTISRLTEPLHAAEVRSIMETTESHSIVYVGCEITESLGQIQKIFRRAGADPLGVEVLDLGPYCGRNGSDSSTIAQAAIRCAAARVQAYPGSAPDNVKSRMIAPKGAVSRRGLFSLATLAALPVPSVLRERCRSSDGCEQCVSACPHGSLSRQEGAIEFDRTSCTSCGICVADCPWEALQFPRWSPREIESQLGSIAQTQDPGRVSLLFACHRAGIKEALGWVPFQIPCQAFVTVPLLLHALSTGADAVAVCSCGDQCENDGRGRAERCVDYCRNLLQRLGDSPQRVQLLDATDGRVDPPPELPQLLRDPSAVPGPRVFGWPAIKESLDRIVPANLVADFRLEHAGSPLGIIEIDEAVCTLCATCTQVCPTNALHYTREDRTVGIRLAPDRCIACGLCIDTCPELKRGAISLSKTTDLGFASQRPHVLVDDEEVHCEACGRPYSTKRMIRRLNELLGEGFHAAIGPRCPECRGVHG